MNPKYISFDNGVVAQAIVFHASIQHNVMRDMLRARWPEFELLGAGFVVDGKPEGESDSLRCGVGKDDSFLLEQLLRG